MSPDGRARLALAAWGLALSLGCTPPTESETAAGTRTLGAAAARTRVTSAPEICRNASDDNGNGLADEGCGLTTGLAQFLVAWEEPTADVDLRVTDPNGELVESGRPTRAGLIKERDCPGRDDDACAAQNLENVFLEQGKLPRGEYRVKVRLVSLGVAEPPIRVRFAARLGQESVEAAIVLTRPEAEWATVLEY